MKISELQAGTLVRMKRNPGRTGSITGKTRGTNHYQIRFGDGLQWIPKNQIEIIPERDDLFEIFKHGNLGGPNDLEQVLRHTRISGKLSNIFYSMESTNTDFHAFQYKPILKILDSPSNSLLIADEVGLGKTIEAGLIWTELRSRLDYRNLLVVCPAMLREKWRIELKKRFGVEASIVDAKNLETKLRETKNHLGVYGKEFALIASMQGIRSSKTKKSSQDLHKTLEEFKYEEPIIDLLIIDEAHYLKNPNSKTHEIGRLLVAISNHRLFLSATPIHLGSEDLFHILNLLDETTFYNNDIFDEILNANAPLVKAIDFIKQSPPNIDGVNKYLEKATKHPLLKMNRQLKHLKEEMKNNEITNLQQASQISYKLSDANLLSNIVTRTRKRDIQINRVVRHPISEIIPMSPVENKAYNTVTKLIEKYAKNLPISEAFLIVMPQKRLSSCMAAGVGHWESLKNSIGNEQEKSEWDFLEQKQYDIGPLNQYLMDNVQKIGDYNELRRDDSKYERLIEILRNFNAKYKKEKVILFSFFKATLRYLHDRLTQDGYSSLLLMGGNNNKDEIIAEFKSNHKYTILLSSEVASEGVDLQFARFLINYDLPWNPMKIEQRIGRIDRIGQIADKIIIWNLAYQNTIDELILERLYNRLDIFRYALGDIEDVLGKKIQQLTSELLSGQLSEDEKNERIVLTKRAVENKINEERNLEERASSLMVHGDYILQKINNAKQNNQWIRAEDIACYTIEFLKKEYKNFEAVRLMDSKYKHIYKIKMPSDAKYQFEEFIKNRNISFHSSLISTDPKPVICVFDNKIVIEFNEFEIINHLHPIIQWIGESINASLLHLYPVSRIQVKRDDTNIPSHTFIPGKYGYAIQYWNIKGLREYNQLAYNVISIAENDFLDDYNADQLIKSIIRKGKPFYNKMLTKELEEYEEYIFRAKAELDDKFSEFIDYNNCLNQDFADIQERNCKKYYDMHSKHLSRIISDHKNRLMNAISPAEEGRFRGLIKVNQNKLSRTTEQYQRKIRSISESRAISCDNTDIAIGLIEVLP